MKTKYTQLNRSRAGVKNRLGAVMLIIAAGLLGSGCASPGGSKDKCALSANQNADAVLTEALAGINSGCGQSHFNQYLDRLITVSKTAPKEPDRTARVVELLDVAEAKGVISHQSKVETVNQYFNVKFVAAKSKSTIFSKGCANKDQFFRSLDAELRLKRVGLQELGDDVASYNSAKALSDNLKGTFEAACQASDS